MANSGYSSCASANQEPKKNISGGDSEYPFISGLLDIQAFNIGGSREIGISASFRNSVTIARAVYGVSRELILS